MIIVHEVEDDKVEGDDIEKEEDDDAEVSIRGLLERSPYKISMRAVLARSL